MGHIIFEFGSIIVKFLSQTSTLGELCVEISSFESDFPQLLSLEQVCTLSLPPVSTLEDLYILEDSNIWLEDILDDVENARWLQLLHLFPTVKNLYLCNEFVPRIALTLEELVGARTAEVLPTLENIFLEGLQQLERLHEGIEMFVAARRLTSHPVTVSRWDKDSK